MIVAIVYRVDFDNIENRDAIRRKRVAAYVGTLADRYAGCAIVGLTGDAKRYTGWDGNHYPRFEVETFDALTAEGT